MSEQDRDMKFRDLIAKALIPPGFRPTNNKDIEALLDTINDEQLNEELIERIIAKAKGELSIGVRQSYDESQVVFTEKEQELLALHRSQGQELPAEIQKKLEELRKKAQEEQQDIEGESDE